MFLHETTIVTVLLCVLMILYLHVANFLVLTGYSTERSETYQQQEGSRTATLDLKKRRQNSLHDLTNGNQYTLSSVSYLFFKLSF